MTEKKRKQVLPDQIHLLSVKILKGNLSAEDSIDEQEGKEVSFTSDYKIQLGTSIEGNAVRIVFTIILACLNNKKEFIASAEYTIEFIFTIQDLQEFIDQSKDPFIMDNHLVCTLLAIVYSTTRGIVLTRTQGTIMEGIIMPVVNPTTLLESIEIPQAIKAS